MIWLALKASQLVDRIQEFWWEVCIWLRVRIRPDKRPADVILAEVKERLEQMPAAKEIHEAHRLIEQVQVGRSGGQE